MSAGVLKTITSPTSGLFSKILFSKNYLKELTLDKFILLKNNFTFKLSNTDPNKNELFIDIQGKNLDISFLDIKKTKSQLKNINMYLDIDVDNLYYINDTNFDKAKLKGKFNNVWQNLNFWGSYEVGGELNILLHPNSENGRFFEIVSSNAEKTLKIKKVTKSITGGKLIFILSSNLTLHQESLSGEVSVMC